MLIVWAQQQAAAAVLFPVHPPPEPGPLDTIWDEIAMTSLEADYGLANPVAIFGIVTRYEGDLTALAATHGGEALELINFTKNDAGTIATALFLGNGLTIEHATLAVTPVGDATIGPAMGRINDDYSAAALASAWNAGATGDYRYLTAISTVEGVGGTGNLVYAGGNTLQNKPVTVSNAPDYDILFFGFALGGTWETYEGFTGGAGWTEADGLWSHAGAATYLPGAALGPLGPLIGYEVDDVEIAEGARLYVQILNAGGLYTNDRYDGPFSGNLRKVTGSTGFAGISIRMYALNSVSFGAFRYMDNPAILNAEFGKTLANVNDGAEFRMFQPADAQYAYSAAEAHEG